MVGGSQFSGGPIRIAPGSKTKEPTPDEVALVVDPEDCEPTDALYAHTRFRMTAAFRIAPEALKRYAGRLNRPKMDELTTLRQYGL